MILRWEARILTDEKSCSATAGHIAEADKFWDISSLVPERARAVPRVQKADTTTALIDVDGEKTPAGELIPERKSSPNIKNDDRRDFEYDGDGAISHVRVMPWPTSYTFYSRFAAQAAALWRKKHAKCDPVGFFSYMPQYEQMTAAQLRYYLYWRDLVRHGEYPPAECSYVLLYLYEIINLPKLIPAALGAKLIALVWANYRGAYPYLDKYAGEWLCDYCIIYRTPVPTEIVAPFLPDAAPRLTFPEYMSKDSGADFELIRYASTYDYKKSKYYESFKSDFDAHIPAAAKAGCDAMFAGGIFGETTPMRVLRDGFSGAVVCHEAKYKIEIMYRSPLKSRAVRDAVTSVIKMCENNIRAEKGIKSRFSKIEIPEPAARAIAAYFDSTYPNRYKKKKKDTETDDYMKLYEPRSVGKADIARAMQIESDAWQTAIDLDGENIVFEDVLPDEISAATEKTVETPYGDDEFSSFIASLDAGLLALLKAAVIGSFKSACAGKKIAPAEAERLINEISYDIVGDAVIDGGEIISDYADDIANAIKTNGG